MFSVWFSLISPGWKIICRTELQQRLNILSSTSPHYCIPSASDGMYILRIYVEQIILEETILFRWTDYSSHSALFPTLIIFLNLHVIKELLWGTLKSTAPQPVAKETWVKNLPAIQYGLLLKALKANTSFQSLLSWARCTCSTVFISLNSKAIVHLTDCACSAWKKQKNLSFFIQDTFSFTI